MGMPLPSSSFTYDVFLNFRGSDTRYSFTGNLFKALCDRGIRTFIDDKELERGEEITPSLVKAIHESRIVIPIFSNNYASSLFCLDELVNMMECVKAKGRLVLPIFYDVYPSQVRHLTGSYGEAFAKHEERFRNDSTERLQKWKMALNQAAKLSGHHIKLGERYEHEFIEKIVKDVFHKINRPHLHVTDYPVGMESQVLQLNSLLDVESDDGFCVVGIYGIGGMGKTTLARAVYNWIADRFDGLCFLHNVRESSVRHGLTHLQEKLLFKIVGLNIKFEDVNEGIPIIKQRLHQKKVLLILDDVDQLKQLQVLAGGSDWFGPGSRVIITTRDTHLLTSHGVERTYEVSGLKKKEALELLRWNAFKNKNFDPSYEDILNCVVAYASGLPLALEVIGSNLFGKSIEEWKSALDRYERIPNKDIQKILQVSFDALDEEEKSVFLDIACCFKGHELAEVEDILCAHHGGCMKYHIRVLAEKSLIKFSWKSKSTVTMHDLIEDMGKEIVRRESPEEPGKRSRLWFCEDIIQVLEENTGTGEIAIIYLDNPKEAEVAWDGEAFKRMKNLKTLIIRNGRFSKGPKYLPNSLRVLEWWRYPLQDLPSDFHPKKLVICEFPKYCFMQLAGLMKKFVNLRVLDFDMCHYLTHIPNASGLQNLEKFSFQYCKNLITIHESVGFLHKLKILNASGCFKLRSFPPIKLTSLEKLQLSGCSHLESFPEILGKMENIIELDLQDTSIKELPFSFRYFTRLRRLYLRSFEAVRLSSSIVTMPELVEIIAQDWKGWKFPKQDKDEEKVSTIMSSNVTCLRLLNCNLSGEFFEIGLMWFPYVKDLNLSRSYFKILPECIKECHFLRKLILDYCKHLQEIRGLPPNLEYFSANDCISFTSSCTSMLLYQELHEAGNTMFCFPGALVPKWFEHQNRGPSISFWFRNKFPAISLCFVVGPMIYQWSRPAVIINRCKLCSFDLLLDIHHSTTMNHTYIFDLKKIVFHGSLDDALLQNEWNHAEITYIDLDRLPILIESGIHVFKQKSIMEDIRFTNPDKKKKIDDLSSSQSQSPHINETE